MRPSERQSGFLPRPTTHNKAKEMYNNGGPVGSGDSHEALSETHLRPTNCPSETASGIRLMNKHVVISWLILACLAISAVAASVQESESPPATQPPKEIRQGGYVEKVEPGVDYEQRLPRTAPLDPDQSLKAFRTLPDFELQLVATEPLVRDPVDIAFDEHGHMFVCELITYSERRAAKLGRVSRLEDRDGDGQYDTSTVYVDELEWPTGVLCFDGGIFVASSPDLVYCKDTDGDGTGGHPGNRHDGIRHIESEPVPKQLAMEP